MRLEVADIAESVADHAEAFAEHLEHSASSGDTERRLKVAAIEREIAAIERRNVAKLRSATDLPLQLERLPRFPVDESHSEDASV